MNDIVRGPWRWKPSIGLWSGYFKGESAARIHQPLMTSPWWTISVDDDREDFVRIYPHVLAALCAAEREHEGPEVEEMTLDEAKTLLTEAAQLLQSAKPQHHIDRGLAMHWGRRRKAIVNRVIEAGLWA